MHSHETLLKALYGLLCRLRHRRLCNLVGTDTVVTNLEQVHSVTSAHRKHSVGMDCLAASYNRLPNGPPRFGVGLVRQSGAETQPLGGPHGRRKESNAANLASVVRTGDNNTTPVRGLYTPSSGIRLLALQLVPIHADSSHCLTGRPARSTATLRGGSWSSRAEITRAVGMSSRPQGPLPNFRHALSFPGRFLPRLQPVPLSRLRRGGRLPKCPDFSFPVPPRQDFAQGF